MIIGSIATQILVINWNKFCNLTRWRTLPRILTDRFHPGINCTLLHVLLPVARVLPCTIFKFYAFTALEQVRPHGDVSRSISELCSLAKDLPITEESVNYLCTMGNRLLDNPQSSAKELYQSFCIFRLGNDLSVQLEGIPDAVQLYNMACACGRMAEKNASSWSGGPGWCHVPHRVTANALSWLVAAVGAGWRNDEHMRVDPDLRTVRQAQPADFQAIVGLAAQAKNGF